MLEVDQPRRLARMLAILLIALLWSPTVKSRIAPLAKHASVSVHDLGERAEGKVEQASGLSESSEGEGESDSKVEGGAVHHFAFAYSLDLLPCAAARLGKLACERPELSCGHDRLARERGPPAA